MASRPWPVSASPLAVAQQRGEAGQARVDLVAAVCMVAAVEPRAAFGAQAGAIGTAERVHRLGQRELVVEDAVEVDLVVLVDAQRLRTIPRLPRRPARRCRGSTLGQELLVDAATLHLLDVRRRCSARRSVAAERATLAAHEDAAVRALEAQVGVERPGQLDVRAEA